MEESEVEEAEARGESAGETAAEDSLSVAVVEVTVRRRAGLCLGAAEVETAAIFWRWVSCRQDVQVFSSLFYVFGQTQLTKGQVELFQ